MIDYFLSGGSKAMVYFIWWWIPQKVYNSMFNFSNGLQCNSIWHNEVINGQGYHYSLSNSNYLLKLRSVKTGTCYLDQ